MKKAILFMSVLLVLACNEDKKTENAAKVAEAEVVKEEIKELVVVVNFKTDKTDEFKLMLNNIKADEFQRKNIHVIEKTEPTSSTETITARFGEGNMSNNFSISLGLKEVKEVEIESVSISFGFNAITIKGSELDQFFRTNKFVDFNSESSTLKTKRIEGKHNPTIILKPKSIKALTKVK